MNAAGSTFCSVWLKPIFKSLNDKIIDCKSSKWIPYHEIRSGNIVNLKFEGADSETCDRTYIATSNWDRNMRYGSFLNMSGKHVVLSDKVLKNLKVCMIGSFEV